jgi:hypothetical protein
MSTTLYAWPNQEPNRRQGIVGTVRRVTFQDGSKARMTHPFCLEEAIRFFDPFQR